MFSFRDVQSPLLRPSVVVLTLVGLALTPTPAIKWSTVQLLRSIWVGPCPGAFREVELQAWAAWEAQHGVVAVLPLDVTAVDPHSKPTAASVDLSRPLIIPGALSPDDLARHPLALAQLALPPLNTIPIDYFSDARKLNALVPDERGLLGDIVANITAGGPQKFGTQRIIESHPELLDLAVPEVVNQIWGKRFSGNDLGEFPHPHHPTRPAP